MILKVTVFEKQIKLEKIRKVIHDSAPKLEEKISYGMPAFALKRNLSVPIHFTITTNTSAVNKINITRKRAAVMRGIIKCFMYPICCKLFRIC